MVDQVIALVRVDRPPITGQHAQDLIDQHESEREDVDPALISDTIDRPSYYGAACRGLTIRTMS
jgi:hypothetical protein